MIQRYSLVLCLICAPTVLHVGCGASSSATTAETSGNESAQLEAILSDYEAMRVALAADKLDEVPALAVKLETSAKAAQANATGEVATPIAAIVRDVQALKSGGEPDVVRRHFGDLSHSVVTILASNESLRTNRHVFECPMAQGYQKWVQPTANVENPYMGSSMLRCGGPSNWTP